MRTPSRMMPPRGNETVKRDTFLEFTQRILFFAWIFHKSGLCLVIAFIAFVSRLYTTISSRIHFSKLREKRGNQNIGTFAIALPAKKYDTWIVRAIYEELTIWTNVPIRPEDELKKDLKLQEDDIANILANVVERLNLQINENSENDPPSPVTVTDLICFLCKLSNAKYSSDDNLDDLVIF